jgi:proline dehydrogenase
LHRAAPAHWLVEKTYFKHFVAGKDLNEAMKTASVLSKTGIGTILDYSIESAEGNIDQVVDVLIEAIRLSGKESYTPFSCFKVTALTKPHLLMRINEILEHHHNNPSFAPALDLLGLIHSDNFPEHVETLIAKARASSSTVASKSSSSSDLPTPGAQSVPPALTLVEIETMLLPFARRLERLGEAAREHNHSVLVDAEQSYYQETIHFAAKCLMTRYNKTKPLFYNTYQMYLKASPSKLAEDLEYSAKNNLIWGAKLVRGAYMDGEAIWAKQKGKENPIQPSIEATHKAYNSALRIMLTHANSGRGAVVVASHNEHSMALGSQIVAELGMAPNHPYIHFGQLYGMCDHMSLALAQNGHNVVKYVPFGPVSEVMPYLLRRVAENKGFLASTHKEQGLMLQELKSRFHIPSRQPQPLL